MEPYLAHSEWIDWQHPAVLTKARELTDGASDAQQVAQRCFEFVRDRIRHSWDYRDDPFNPVTCRASDVLLHATGYCYAKSHLLAALLRANGIPAGLCYQYLSLEGGGFPYTLHGLNTVHLESVGWYRIDPRGNKPGVDAQFCPPLERLAFPADDRVGERDYATNLPEPLPEVVGLLTRNATVREVYADLPILAEAVVGPAR
ncbi:transglutaminase-like domain-containing protein [Crenobacter sp. SG2303]|uniref:Transglutaminase-like domain-containing protein n=1 Tax=Crenobacter oryzisoli TaxID=3056844 RepID=A0ABT7XJV1_9NEIS|nr:transglutaminase-like domain-containing protein [Crenobacter sp. SG2303]MDN0074070.1 transglutaminase-like domain-containing protein [Crenobacter sp. SG2303]